MFVLDLESVAVRRRFEAALDLVVLDLCTNYYERHGDHKPAASHVDHLIVVQSSCRMQIH